MRAFTAALRASGITAPLYLTQNDGTVVLAEVADAYPVYSFASGPTNSMRGAAFLSKRTTTTDPLVIDVGGTTTDIAMLRGGRPVLNKEGATVGGWKTDRPNVMDIDLWLRLLQLGDFLGLPETLAAFRAYQVQFIDRLRQANGLDLSRARVRSPAVRWLRLPLGSGFALVVAHERRHLKQARNVIADPAFPR